MAVTLTILTAMAGLFAFLAGEAISERAWGAGAVMAVLLALSIAAVISTAAAA